MRTLPPPIKLTKFLKNKGLFVFFCSLFLIFEACEKDSSEDFTTKSGYSSGRKSKMTMAEFRKKWKTSQYDKTQLPQGVIPLTFKNADEADYYLTQSLRMNALKVVSEKEKENFVLSEKKKNRPITQSFWFGTACTDIFNEDLEGSFIMSITGHFKILFDCQSNSGNGGGEIEVKEVDVITTLAGFHPFVRYEEAFASARAQSQKLRDNIIKGNFSGTMIYYIGVEGMAIDMIFEPTSGNFSFPHYITD
jgi:hypothetical protein